MRMATQVTTSDLSADVELLAAGQTHLIHAMNFNNQDSVLRIVDVREADTTTPIFRLTVPAETTVSANMKWICERGLWVAEDDNLIQIWIYHNSTGV